MHKLTNLLQAFELGAYLLHNILPISLLTPIAARLELSFRLRLHFLTQLLDELYVYVGLQERSAYLFEERIEHLEARSA